MNRSRLSLSLSAFAAAVLTVVALLPGVPAYAQPCYAATCEGMYPTDVPGCDPFYPFGGAGSPESVLITVEYSAICHVAYVELDLAFPESHDDPPGFFFFTQDQYGSPESFGYGAEAISSTVVYGQLISWDHSIKGCYVLSSAGIGGSDWGEGFEDGSNTNFCTPWF